MDTKGYIYALLLSALGVLCFLGLYYLFLKGTT